MGTSESKKLKETTLKLPELNEFHLITSFSNEILLKLHEHYRHFSAVHSDDGLIDFDEFCTLINKNDKNLTKRIFNAIDTNKDGQINFREFVKFISCFLTGTLEDQISISFKLFQNEKTKLIEKNIILELLKDVIKAENSLNGFLTDELIEVIVNETFKTLTDDGLTMDFDLYKNMVNKNNDILNWLKVDLDKIKKVTLNPKIKKKVLCGPF